MTIGAIGSPSLSIVHGATSATAADGARFAALIADAGAPDGEPASRADFTRISPRAMREAAQALVDSGRMKAPALEAAVDLAAASEDQDSPINMIAYLRHEAAQNEKAPGGMTLAFRQKAALAALIHVQRDEGVPVVYDHAFPTAPRDLTPEEINAKLKEAIAAFRKEADRTPAERLAKKLRAEVMKDMTVTDDDLSAMPEAERALMEKKIGDEVARRMALLGFTALDGKGAGQGSEAADAVAG